MAGIHPGITTLIEFSLFSQGDSTMKKRFLAAIAWLPMMSFAHVTAEPHPETLSHILATAQAHPFESVLMLVAVVCAGIALYHFFNGRA
ncbi:Uncharacterised protein [Grimontia hollisae]|uniref:Uncharacterized protein n=2 Tax=Grimontia hollisae TaxID=673 RepID=A0A377J8I1_GRIHO|nr:Uncharacterised protein [Grimontia hollisae]